MSTAAAHALAEVLAPRLSSRDPFVEARRLQLRLVAGSCCRCDTAKQVQYDAAAGAAAQRYGLARAVLAYELRAAGLLRGLSADVSLRELVAILFGSYA